MDVIFTPTVDDFVALQKIVRSKGSKARGTLTQVAYPLVFCFGLGILLKYSLLHTAIFALVVTLLSVLLTSWELKRRARAWAAKNPAYFTRTTVSISPEGLRVKSDAEDALVGWVLFRDIIDEMRFLCLLRTSGGALAIPKSAFDNPDEARRFVDSTISYWKAARAAHPKA